jgi:ABC-type Fe3+-hydroxamate transport system substrate-binding protein
MRALIIVAAAALCACGAPTTATTEIAAGCEATASSSWTPAGGASAYGVTAASEGADCANANATLTITDAAGAVVWTETFPANQVMMLAHATTPEDMTQALAEWVNPNTSPFQTTADLPVWPVGAEGPTHEEFPFYPEEGARQDTYEGLRSRAVPVICYVQGMESSACLTLENGQLNKIGIQTFPG